MKLRAALLAMLGAFVSFAPARAEYPDKQITMVVCFPAGGGTDIAARLVNTQLGEALGVAGDHRELRRRRAATSRSRRGEAAAGRRLYRCSACSSAYVVNPSLYASAAYDPIKDFVPLMVMGASPNVFVVPEKSPIKSMKEFIEKAKANPGKMNWTSPGAGTTPQHAGELIRDSHRHQDAAHPVPRRGTRRATPRSLVRSISTPRISARCRA